MTVSLLRCFTTYDCLDEKIFLNKNCFIRASAMLLYSIRTSKKDKRMSLVNKVSSSEWKTFSQWIWIMLGRERTIKYAFVESNRQWWSEKKYRYLSNRKTFIISVIFNFEQIKSTGGFGVFCAYEQKENQHISSN